ncbi:MAG: histidine phosphatase family protein [Trebonia sp.]
MSLTSTSAPPATLWLVRHGESTWNTLGLAQGHDDRAELTSHGRRQAEEVAGQFRGTLVGAVYASDLRRVQQTAAPLAALAGVPVVLDPRLRERGLGVLEGTPAAGNGPAATGLDLTAGLITDPDKRPDGGESVRDLYRRAAAFLDDLAAGALPAAGARSAPGNPPDGDVVIVAHGGTLRVLAAYLTGVPVESMDWTPLANATVMKFPHPTGGAK